MASSFAPGTASLPTSEVELSISCRNLSCEDVLSKSDSMCVTYQQPFGTSTWVEMHRTECIKNCENPDFTRKILMPYRFEERQLLKFEIYDIDSSSSKLSDHDFLGSAQCALGQIVSSGQLQIQLSNGFRGSMIITAEELSSQKDEVTLAFCGSKLDKKDMFGKSDPFLVINKVLESGQYVVVHKTEVMKNTLNPVWKPFSIPVRTLCNGDYDRSLKFICYDYDSDGSNDLIGEFCTTLRELSSSTPAPKIFQCINPEKKKKKRSYTHSGEIRLTQFRLQPIHSFMDYIKGGTQINCTVAIDFTGSNGNPLSPNSLHYIGSPQQPNAYEQAINSVVSILQDYDSDKMFPVLGFGAKLPPDGRVSHEFFVNMSHDNPYVYGVAGVLQAYRSCLSQIQLYGPTNFSPVIRHVARFAEAHQNGSNYFVLLILTDGVISDMQHTIQAIVGASSLPMSIIIVGIGNADFSAMDALDADTVGLQAQGVMATRDIVQFVPFQRFVSMYPDNARLLLAKEVLAEVPTQFTSYMKLNRIVPNPPKQAPVALPPDPEAMQT
ncbi:hypothetical protein B566_EDAN001579 [Ephemera danica]|nr:hypothetical protein B566_EDAN001579 [Ephemera danica]